MIYGRQFSSLPILQIFSEIGGINLEGTFVNVPIDKMICICMAVQLRFNGQTPAGVHMIASVGQTVRLHFSGQPPVYAEVHPQICML